MANALLAALVGLSAVASPQTGAETAPAPTPAQSAPAPQPGELDQVRREVDETRKEIREMREELRAQMATQSAEKGWDEDWVEQTRKLELFEPDGYFRVRPDLFHRFDLNRAPDPSGFSIFPRSPLTTDERTQAGVNMRFRFEPTLHISEQVRLRIQVDALDNVIFGTNPDYAFSRGAGTGFAFDRNEFSVFSESQVPPRSGVTALSDSIMVKRVYGEVSTPVGILRFGRMGSHWGLGMLHNDGNCLDCDDGDTVDRLMFVTEPFTGIYVTPMLDFNAEGPHSTRESGLRQPFDLSNRDDSHSFIVAIARRDTEEQARAKLDSGLAVFNYGVHFTYRVQRFDPVGFYGPPFTNEGGDLPPGQLAGVFVNRNASLYIPDVWVRYERRAFRVELEAAAVFGSIGNRALDPAAAEDPTQNQALNILQYGAVAQGEYRLMEGSLKLGLEVGFASGDPAPGFGNFPRRGQTEPGDIDGAQYNCTVGCIDDTIANFRFNRDYRVDMILFRELLGGITDALYARPSLTYQVAPGFDLFGAVIYSRSLYAASTPSSNDPNLGVELNVGARYETDDGFFASLAYGILFPLGGLADPRPGAAELQSADALRGMLGVRF